MNQGLIAIRRVLVTVSNKVGIDAFCAELRSINPELEIIATGNTASVLKRAGIPITELSDYTGFPECFGGRVKTLHPKIEGGILFRRGEDDQEAERLNIPAIDMVICNLYDFAAALKEENCDVMGLLEKVDIGGSTLIRSSSKNFPHVTVVTDPADYLSVIQEMHANEGCTSIHSRARLATKAFNLSADYDGLIATEFSRRLTLEETLRPKLVKGRALRYGENPDQQAWVYELENEQGIAQARILNGKELSYNNYEDSTAAYTAVQELLSLGATNGVAIVKHGGLCGYASSSSLGESFRKAWAGDPKSAFGGVIAFGCPVTEELIHEIEFKFMEVLIAPEFSPEFVSWAKANKRSLRLLRVAIDSFPQMQFKRVSGGILVQTPKRLQTERSMKPLMKPASPQAKRKIGVVTETLPKAEQETLFNFALAAVKFAKSNAVAIVREHSDGGYQLLGMGAGQPNRVDSLERLAIPKAIDNLKSEHKEEENYDPIIDLAKCILASDGFFPFADSIRVAANAGFKTCIQPGGSVRDDEVIAEAEEHDMCMIFSGERAFSH